MNSLYHILFKDGSQFDGGTSFFDTKWKEIPNKKIVKIFYRLPGGDYLLLLGYDKYFHMVEATNDLNGKNKGKTQLESVYIMGKLKDKVIIYKIGLRLNKNLGKIEKQIKNIEDEEIKRLNFQNWK